jgi:hypothetical protein
LKESAFLFLPGRFISYWLRMSQVATRHLASNIATPGGGGA